MQSGKRLADLVHGIGIGVADAEVVLLAVAVGGHPRLCVIVSFQHVHGLREEAGADRRERYRACSTIDQADSEFPLQCLKLF